MIRKFAKLLPYWVIMKCLKKFGGSIGTFGKDTCLYFRIDKGEFIIFDKDNYTRMSENAKKERETKLQKQMNKLNKKLDKNYSLKEELKKQFDYEEMQRKEIRDDE